MSGCGSRTDIGPKESLNYCLTYQCLTHQRAKSEMPPRVGKGHGEAGPATTVVEAAGRQKHTTILISCHPEPY